jgi:hypothetical protein
VAKKREATEKEPKEATDKAVEEEIQKKHVETRNDDTQLMYIDILEVSTIGPNT